MLQICEHCLEALGQAKLRFADLHSSPKTSEGLTLKATLAWAAVKLHDGPSKEISFPGNVGALVPWQRSLATGDIYFCLGNRMSALGWLSHLSQVPTHIEKGTSHLNLGFIPSAFPSPGTKCD